MRSLVSPQPGATDVSEGLAQDLLGLSAELLRGCREREPPVMML